MKFKNFQVENEVFLAPMAGVTDLPFRLICKEYGSGLLYTEMINAKALCFDDANTKRMLKTEEAERPVAVQIFGSEPEFMGSAARILNDYEYEIIDINMGCPAPKVVKNGDGSALMKNPKLAYSVMKAVVDNTDKPVTVKIRKGWNDASINAVEIAELAQKAGVCALTVHGRTREQYYSGKADWDIIRDIKNTLDIPVIGNGDVTSVEDAIAIREHTGCDAIMIGRGAQGNPWIFERINTYLKTGIVLDPPTPDERLDVAVRHLSSAIEAYGEYVGIREMRKHIGWYLKGMRGSARFRDLINKAEHEDEVISLIEQLRGSLKR